MLKIAAGEVIDRPFSVVRELLDNSLDAESSNITLWLEDGGKSKIRVLDDGHGMSREDLEICFLPHTTSKIKENEDLYKIRTLGFRGEALSSISACSRLEITSKLSSNNSPANKLIVQEGKIIDIGPSKGNPGTSIDVNNIFYNMPARKKFLKSSSAETKMCRNIFTDRALAYPERTFRLFLNDKLKDFYPEQDHLQRITTAYSNFLDIELFDILNIDDEAFNVLAVLGKPELVRKDRKLIQIFVNKRRIQEYSLMQAVEYSYSEYMPGGSFPAAFLFIDIKPELIDFNIHPAKREVKFLNLNVLHKKIVTGIKSHLKQFNINLQKSYSFENSGLNSGFNNGFSNFIPKRPDNKPDLNFYDKNIIAESNSINSSLPTPTVREGSNTKDQEQILRPKYIGRLFDVFLICEYENNLYILDQHAAHEKILYNLLISKEKSFQELLFPISFDTSDSESENLIEKQPELEKLGIIITKIGINSFEIISLAIDYIPISEAEIIKFLKDIKHPFTELEHRIYSIAACRKAIKEGDIIDNYTAEKLIIDSLSLENARCPHGRPIWHMTSKEQLYKLLKRK